MAGALVSAAVVVSTFGALNGVILTGPRVYYAMAKDNLFFKQVAKVHPRYKTPGVSILIQAIWACLLTLSGTYEQLFTYVTFATIVFYIFAVTSVFTLRKKYPELPRPYKTWGYPWLPVIFIIAMVILLINTLFSKPVESFAGIVIIALGLPAYFFWKKKGRGAQSNPRGVR
jgi:APA family basic amino acid/polyamine antiporter